MGWKENKKKHDDYVDFVTKVLTGEYTLVRTDGDYSHFLKQYLKSYLKEKYNWDEKDYDIKKVSKRKNKYHFIIYPYDIIENIDIKIQVEE